MKCLEDWLEYIGQVPSQLGLERITCIAKKLELLPPPYFVITIAGTNGKGTTAHLIELAFRTARYQTALFTSPSLLRFNEMIEVNGKMVEDCCITEALSVIEASREEILLTQFEFTVLAALLIFRKFPLDIVILEVGLGGRLDAVNVVDPDLSVITTIDLDHTDILGDNRELIGYQKAGIFRPFKPAICGALNCPESVKQHARTIGALLYCLNVDFFVEVEQKDKWNWKSEHCEDSFSLPYGSQSCPLQNAATALMVLRVLKNEFPVSVRSFNTALFDLHVPGRFHVIHKHCTVILDVAHNIQAARLLVDNLSKNCTCQGDTFAVFSTLCDKDTSGMINIFKSTFEHWLVAPLSVPRAQPLEVLQRCCVEHNICADYFHNICEAYNAAIKRASPEDRIVVCGSFHVVSPILQILSKK